MKKGGNAFDAIVATGFTLAVTSPSNGNIGGGGFMVARTAEGEIVTLDFREKAPTLSYETMFLDQEGNYSRNLALLSHKSSGVPGTVDGLIRIFNDYGSGNFTLDEILSYAIDYAENRNLVANISNWDPSRVFASRSSPHSRIIPDSSRTNKVSTSMSAFQIDWLYA